MKIAHAVVVIALALALAACVDAPDLEQASQADTEREPPGSDVEVPWFCDQDGDGWLNPACGGCDLDDLDPLVGKKPNCDEIFKCPSYVCVPPGGDQ